MTRIPWGVVMLVLLVLAGPWLLAGIFQPRPANPGFAGVASQALDMAKEAHRDAMVSNRNGTLLRVLALTVGVVAPLVVAYLVHRLHSQSELPPEEVLDTLEKAKLLDWKAERERLPDGTHAALPEKSAFNTPEPPDDS